MGRVPSVPRRQRPARVRRPTADAQARSGPDIVEYLAAAAQDLSVDQDYIEEMDDRLRRKGQIVLYGPPGTGKTFFAKRFARAVARDHPDGVRIVQFHPSTSYEDFVEGIRPRTEDGAIRYELVDGPLKLLAQQADLHRDQDFVLLIDELNRANLPRVFGELLYLLEYRRSEGEQGVNLLYRPEEKFVLPPNLFIVATMNTADRSVALIDAALRRRFAFFPFFPDRPPVKDMLRKWLSKHDGALPVADFLEAVNEELAQRAPQKPASWAQLRHGRCGEVSDESREVVDVRGLPHLGRAVLGKRKGPRGLDMVQGPTALCDAARPAC